MATDKGERCGASAAIGVRGENAVGASNGVADAADAAPESIVA
jgi:hypothetical protein